MTATTASARRGQRLVAIVLAIVGLLAIILGVLFLAGALNSVSFLVGSVHKGHHDLRAGFALVVGVVLFVAAFLTARTR